MKLWIGVLVINLLVPTVMLMMGILYLKKPSTDRNGMYGYRTERSIQSQEAWDYAQTYFGNSCCRLGTGILLLLVILMAWCWERGARWIGISGTVIGTIEGLAMVYLLIHTEAVLKKKFRTQQEEWQ